MALTAKKVYAILKHQISDMEAKLNSPVRYRGTVATADLLPLNPDIGDMYNIESKSVYGEAGMNVAWNGVVWDTMGAPIDMSLYLTKEEAESVIQRLVTEYFEKNPVKPGATTEQAQQIEKNKTDIASLKTETSSLKEDIAETDSYEKEVFLNEKDVLYPVFLPVGSEVTFKTVDGSNFDGSVIRFFDSNKKDISAGGWQLKKDVSSRTVTMAFATDDKAAYYTSTTNSKAVKIVGCRNGEKLSYLYEDVAKNKQNIDNFAESSENINEFLFHITIDNTSGIVPIYVKKDDEITFSTVDGSNFDGSTIIFYNIEKNNISGPGWTLSKNISSRTVTMAFATDDDTAYYISTSSAKKIEIAIKKSNAKFSDFPTAFEANVRKTNLNVSKIDSTFYNVQYVPALDFIKFYIGGIDADGSIITTWNYRVYSDLFNVKSDATFQIEEGKRFGVQFYDDSGEAIQNTGWLTKAYTVPKGSLIRLTISNFKTTSKEEYNYIADVNVLPNVLQMKGIIYGAIEANAQAIEANAQAIEANAQAIEVFDPGKWVQGSIYEGVLLTSNMKCITYSEFFYCGDADFLKLIRKNTDGTRWNIRITFYDNNFIFLSQVGYSEIDIFKKPQNATYCKVSISLLDGSNNPDISPSDYTDNRIIEFSLHSTSVYKAIRNVREDSSKIREDMSNLEDMVDTIKNNGIPSGIQNGYYSGAKITVKKNAIAYEKYMQIDGALFGGQPIQGCAQYNDLLFVTCNTMAIMAIFDLQAKALVTTIAFSPVSTYHCNSMNFGAEKYADDDEFPLLYISMENIAEHKMIALRIVKSSDGIYSGEIKQTITYPAPSESTQYYPNGSLDNENGYLFVKGYILNNYVAGSGNKIRVRKWAMPTLSEGDVTLSIADALQVFDVPALTATQGEIVNNGKLLGCYGADWAGDKSIHLAMIDPDQQKMVTDIKLSDIGYKQEPEAIFTWKDCLYIVDVYGSVNKIYL